MQLNLNFLPLSGYRRGRCCKIRRVRQEKPIEPVRKFDCRAYSDCLNAAARRGLREIGCEACPKYERIFF